MNLVRTGRHFCPIALTLVLASCGGGGGGDLPAVMQVQNYQPLPGPTRRPYEPPGGTPSTSPVAFTYLVQNLGQGTARNVRLLVSAPPQLRVVDIQCALPPDSIATCPPAGSASIPTMPPSSALLVSVLMQPVSIQSVLAQVTLTATADNDPSPANNFWTFQSKWYAADVRVSYAAPPQACPGTAVELVAVIQNVGPDIVDLYYLPNQLGTWTVSFSNCLDSTGAKCGPGAYRPNTPILDLLRIPVGATWIVNYRADIPLDATGDQVSTFSFVNLPDPSPTDNIATARVTVAPSACSQ